ncbi:unnamed protein product [Pleuronectes platessa]|uniref:Uncharacterized protein n=1 Tax=Pleuronectes platessa TaxID=8262 RepID=A0A9N7Y5B0_PLEPL|nr:unnamed protein product [Pleuronectes platessa]
MCERVFFPHCLFSLWPSCPMLFSSCLTRGPIISCWTHGHEEIKASAQALQLTSGLSPGCGAWLVVGQLNRRVCE